MGDDHLGAVEKTPLDFDSHQYDAGEFAYEAYSRYLDDEVEHMHFRSLGLDEQKAWAYMASEFKKRFSCEG